MKELADEIEYKFIFSVKSSAGSMINSENKRSPKIDPCGMPDVVVPDVVVMGVDLKPLIQSLAFFLSSLGHMLI